MDTARDKLLDVIHFTECANQGTTPAALLDAYRDQVLAEAGELIRTQGADCCAGEHTEAHADLLLAARATQES